MSTEWGGAHGGRTALCNPGPSRAITPIPDSAGVFLISDVTYRSLRGDHPVIRRALLGDGGVAAHLATLRPVRPTGAVSMATDRTGEEARWRPRTLSTGAEVMSATIMEQLSPARRA